MPKRTHPSSHEADFEWVLNEVRGQPRAKQGQLTPSPHWEKLMYQVSLAAGVRVADPSHPLHHIGRFEAIRTRGVGGFGVVFEVRDPELDRHVALKLCQTRGPKAADGLMNEARLLARLTHPNIVTVYEPGRHGDDVFFVMEYVNGVNAHHFAQQDPAPSWEQLVDVYRGAGRGLAAAHDAGIVHGDFKPSNVLLDEHHWPRVADFGLAQVMIDNAPDDEQEQLRHRAGTLPYMAPEVLRGQAGDTRADQWSFCVSLWESLDDALPFIGWTTAELLDDIERDQPVAMNPDVPEAVRAVLRIGLAQDPDNRYPSMYALVEALDRLRQPLGVDTPSSPRRGVFFGAMLLACGLGLGGGILVSGVPDQAVEPGEAVMQASTASVEPIDASLASNEVLEPDGETLSEISDNNDARATVEQVIAYIELGNIREASAAWEQEFDIREVSDEARAHDAHRIAEAFLASAIALKNQGNINWRFAAWESTRWAARISTLLRQEQGTKGRDHEDHALWRADADRINDAAQALLTSGD